MGDLESVGWVISKRVHVITADVVENIYFSDGMDMIEKEAAEFYAILDAGKLGIGGFPEDVALLGILALIKNS